MSGLRNTQRFSMNTEHSEKESGMYKTADAEEIAITLTNFTTASSAVNNYHGLTLTASLVYLSCFLLSIAQILTLVGSGAFSRIIASDLGNDTQGIWLAQIPTIYVCSIGPTISQASDLWGRRWFLTIMTFFGLIGSVVIAKASNWPTAVGGQIINAVAFAVSPLLYAVVSEITPRKYRGLAQCGLTIGNGVGAIFCLVFGEWLVYHSASGWRIFFYIIGAFQGMAAIVFGIFYRPPPRQLQLDLGTTEKIRKIDWLGSLLLVAGIVPYSMGLSWSQNPYPWRDAHVSATFAIGILSLIAFALYETFGTKQGMFHHGLFKRDRNYPIALMAVFAEGFAFYSVNGYFVFESSVLYIKNPVLLGTQFSLTFIVSCFSSLVAAFVIAKAKKFREMVVLGFTFTTIFSICMATTTLDGGNAVWAFASINGLSFGLLLVCLVTAAQLSAPPDLIAVASGLVIGTRSLGASTGLPVFNAIFNHGLSKHLASGIATAVLDAGLPPQSLPAVIAAIAGDQEAALFHIPGVTPAVAAAGFRALQQAYLLAFRYVWVCAGTVTFCAAILSCFLINPERDINMHVDAPLKNDEGM